MSGVPDLKLPVFTTDFSITDRLPNDLDKQVAVLRSMQLLPQQLIAPMFVLLDITGECNLTCAYCYNESGKSECVSMEHDQMFHIAEELIRMKVFNVCVCGGEPTLHPYFIKLIKMLKNRGIIVSSITNGFDINNETARAIAQNIAIMQVTLDGPDSKTHDRLRGNGSFDRAIDAIEHMKKEGLRHLRIAFTATKHNSKEFYRMLELCINIGAQDLRTMPLVPVGRAFNNRPKIMPTTEDILNIKRQIKNWKRGTAFKNRLSVEWGSPHQHIPNGLALGYVIALNISPEGYYKPSPYLPIAFGCANEMSVSEAWRSGLANAWLHPQAQPIFSKIKSVSDFAEAYKTVKALTNTPEGFYNINCQSVEGERGIQH